MQIIDTIKRKVRTLVHTERILTKKIEDSFIYPLLPDKVAINLVFYNVFGRRVNWKNPKSFNEKLQWLKLYNRNPLYSKLVDKYEVKKWVAEKIGDQYIIPTYGVWNSFNEIDFSELPDKFVLKTTHGGGNTGVVICKDKSKFDIEGAKERLNKSLRSNTYMVGREWPYKNVLHRILAEQYIEPSLEMNDLHDYKFFCFAGECKLFKIDFDRATNHHANYYYRNGQITEFGEADIPPVFNKELRIPDNLSNMIDVAEIIAKETGNLFCRVDFYNNNGKIFFGEITFFPASGFGLFTDKRWDYKLGEWISLPIRK